MKPTTCLLFATVLTLSAVGLAQAEKADKDLPMHIVADSLQHDDAQQISVFAGQVQANKGSIVLRGGRLEIRQSPKGNQSALLLGTADQVAFFRQKREGLPEFMEGQAERIEYDGDNDVMTLIGKAQLRRLRGTTLADVTSGQRIVYNNSTEVFTVDGKNPQGSGRVRTTLTPRNAVGAAPSATPALPLKP
jgi:lipopolysaccharide export system protein LptA